MITKRKLNRAIKKAGNQSKLAEYLGFDRRFLSQIKLGKRPFPLGRLDRLEELLNEHG